VAGQDMPRRIRGAAGTAPVSAGVDQVDVDQVDVDQVDVDQVDVDQVDVDQVDVDQVDVLLGVLAVSWRLPSCSLSRSFSAASLARSASS
jgi:hypothetical protein